MYSNLVDKIRLLVKDTEDLGPEAKAKAILRLIENEIALREEVRYMDMMDFQAIKARAVSIFNEKPSNAKLGNLVLAQDPETKRMLSLMEATLAHVRGKGLSHNIISFAEKTDTRKP